MSRTAFGAVAPAQPDMVCWACALKYARNPDKASGVPYQRGVCGVCGLTHNVIDPIAYDGLLSKWQEHKR